MQGVVIGGYRVTGRLGAGTIAEAFLASNARGKTVVAKKLADPFAAQDKVKRNFLGISQQSARIRIRKHVAVIAGQHSSTDGVYLLREYVEGESLRDLLERGELTRRDGAGQVLRDLCEALRALQRGGVVHGGIHPGNVIVQPDGRAKLTDFCASRFALSGSLASSYPLGALRYLAPEQWGGASGGTWRGSVCGGPDCVLARDGGRGVLRRGKPRATPAGRRPRHRVWHFHRGQSAMCESGGALSQRG